ncbi:aminotransferase class IV [Nocardioides ferulae]|uniref:aminotransferase class IV n=1 Tax=Nocardioides ferulae TaxID=2340821 RepID=UPI0013DD8F38|nr:aminotransferase class IV [Nocardioides ferulae]
MQRSRVGADDGIAASPEVHTLDGIEVDAVPPGLALHPFGVFTTFVMVDGSVLGWPDHVTRLTRDARLLWGCDLDPQRLSSDVLSHARRVGPAPARVRVTLYPEAMQMMRPIDARGCRILVSSGPAVFPFLPEHQFTVRTCEYQRELPDLKTTDTFTQIRRRREAQLAGFDDALFVRRDQVLEGSTWTVVTWCDGQVATPAGPVLESITAVHLAAAAEELGWSFVSRPITVAELAEADLVLAVNAVNPARAIRRVDARSLNLDHALLAEVAGVMSSRERHHVGASAPRADGPADPTGLD